MSESPDILIEAARDQDLPGILEILNHYVAHDHCTFDTVPWTPEQKQPWFNSFGNNPRHRLLVGKKHGEILGYAHSGQWRAKRAYDVTIETTVYLAPDAVGLGLGRTLLSALLEVVRGTGARRAVAGIAQPNPASNRLHESLGFEVVGTFHRVGDKFGKRWDVRWYEKAIED